MKRMRALLGPTKNLELTGPITLRYAREDDAAALERLAKLDSRRAPRGVVLLAEVEGTPWAAVSLDDGQAVADPFRPTSEMLLLLHARVRQLRDRAGDRRELPRVWPAAPLSV